MSCSGVGRRQRGLLRALTALFGPHGRERARQLSRPGIGASVGSFIGSRMLSSLIHRIHGPYRASSKIPWGLATLLTLACSYDYEPPPTADGELGRGEFTYRCSGDSDALCPAGSATATSFPQAIALGGRFSLEYAYNSDYEGDPPPILKSSVADRISSTDGIFKALATGYTAINGVSGASEVVDVKHLRVAAIDHLTVTEDQLKIGASVTVEVGSVLSLTAAPYGAQDELLGGDLDYIWSSASSEVAAVAGAGDDDLAVLEGISEGSTTVTVAVGELALEVMVVVVPSSTTATTGDSDSDGTTTGDTDGTTAATTGDTDGTTDATTGDTDGTTDATTDGTTGTTGG